MSKSDGTGVLDRLRGKLSARRAKTSERAHTRGASSAEARSSCREQEEAHQAAHALSPGAAATTGEAGKWGRGRARRVNPARTRSRCV